MKEKEISKLYNSITNVDNPFIEEAQTKAKKKNSWIKWVVTAAACLTLICVVAINYFPHTEDNIVTTADAPPMVFVNGKLYKQSTEQISYDEVKSEFFYLGKIESDITNSQTSTDGVPKENFQANHPIVGAEVYQYNADIVIQINGKYWLYEVLDNENSNDTQNNLTEEEKMQLDPFYKAN